MRSAKLFVPAILLSVSTAVQAAGFEKNGNSITVRDERSDYPCAGHLRGCVPHKEQSDDCATEYQTSEF